MPSNTTAKEIIKLENIFFSYSDKKQKALDDINLTVNEGECILLCGASGCGKSTLLQLINGVIPDYYKGTLEGNVFIDGENVMGKSIQQKSKDIGSVFQNPKSQFFHLNTTDEVCFAAANHLIPKEDIEKKLQSISSIFKIEHLLDKNIFAMSGGEKQRLAIASVAMNSPQIYLLDEPSSNLDKESIYRLKEILMELKTSDSTILIAEHRLYY